MKIEILSTLASTNSKQWDALRCDRHPLLSHAFLYGMEQHGCLTEQSGWKPRYVVIKEKGVLVAAMLLYEKTNSWGEFVFDHAWADAYKRYGVPYYPKLVSAIPFSPVFGQKLLCAENREAALYPVLFKASLELSERANFSSLHVLFPLQKEFEFLKQQGLMVRHDCQYHWRNRNYANFEHFLDQLSHKKRKNIKQERRKVRDEGITFQRLDGTTATAQDWQHFTHFYNLTYERKWGAPIFNQAFFESTAAALGEDMILILASKGSECIAGALMYRSDNRLYGRHWGCNDYYDALHFETCYYQGIEYCIDHGLEIFEPGAQGQHKIARGFEPVLTQSAHWLADDRFTPAVSQFCADERKAVVQHVLAAKAHSPYKQPL